MEQYSRNKEPGIMEHSKEKVEKLKDKEDGGEPMSREKALVRKQCKPKGVIGYLLESIHLKLQNLAAQPTANMCGQSGIPGFGTADTANGGEE